MKRILSIFLSLMFVLSVCCFSDIAYSSALSDNLIKNGGAENGETDWIMFDEWTSALNTSESHTGSDSFEVPNQWRYFYQSITLSKSGKYRLKYYTKGNSNVTMWFGGAYDQNSDMPIVSETMSADNTDWVLVTKTFECTQPGNYYLSFKTIGTDTEKKRFVDDICLFIMPDEIEGNLIKNGSAEDGETDWLMFDEWTSALNTSESHTGGNSFEVPNQWRYFYQPVSLNKGESYKLSYYTKGDGNVVMWIGSEYNQNSGTPLVSHTMTTIDNEWTLVEKEILCDETGIYYLSFKTMGVNTAQKRYVDDISMVVIPRDPNLLKNGGAENGEVDWVLYDEWTSVINTIESHTGLNSFEVPNQWRFFYQAVSLNEGDNLKLSYYTKGDGNATMWFGDVYDQSHGKPLASEKMTSENKDWTLVEKVISCEKTGTYYLSFKSNSSDTTQVRYVDDISLVIISGTELLQNGGFEDNLYKWDTNADRFFIEKSRVSSGNNSLKITSASYKTIYQRFIVFKGKYKLTFKYSGNVPDSITAWSVAKDESAFSGTSIINKGMLSDENPDEWKQVSTVFESDKVTQLFLSFRTQNDAEYYIDDVELTLTEEPVSVWKAANEAVLLDFQGFNSPYDNGGPFISSDSDNLITDNSFELGTGNWNCSSFISDGISVVTDGKMAYSGSNCIRFKAENKETEGIFFVKVKPDTNYYFTAYIKMPRWSKTNTGDMTFGIFNAESADFVEFEDKATEIYRLVNKNNQINPASSDNEWHLVGIKFVSNDTKTVGVKLAGKNAEVYFDNMYLVEEEKAQKYNSPLQNKQPAYVVNNNPTLLDCIDSINMIENSSFDDKSNKFWQNVFNFKKNNTILDSGSSIYGNALLYENDKKFPDRTYYIKWIDVSPNTSYTFSAKYCIITPKNDAFLGIISGDRSNLVYPTTIKTFGFDKKTYDENCRWQTAGVEFNTNDCNRIGFVIFNGGGKAYIDNVKLFRSYGSNGKENGKVMVEKARNSAIPLTFKSSKYSVKNGLLIINNMNLTLNDIVKAFIGSDYIFVFNNDGDQITDLNQKVTENIELRIMDGPEILDRAVIRFQKTAYVKTDAVIDNQTTDNKDVKNDKDNNLLAELIVENAEITPAFTPENKKYETTVSYKVENLIVKAIPKNKNATVAIEGEELTYVGKNIVKVIVHSESGLKRTYKIYVNRLAPVSLKSLQNQSSNKWMIIIIAGAAAMVLGSTATTIIIFTRKKKKNRKQIV